MHHTESWVLEAIDTLGIATRVRRIVEPERSQVLGQVTSAFLERPDASFWWSNLAVPLLQWHTEDAFTHLPRLVSDPSARCWLITGLDDEGKGVFECSPALAPALIGECPGFEYALVDPS